MGVLRIADSSRRVWREINVLQYIDRSGIDLWKHVVQVRRFRSRIADQEAKSRILSRGRSYRAGLFPGLWIYLLRRQRQVLGEVARYLSCSRNVAGVLGRSRIAQSGNAAKEEVLVTANTPTHGSTELMARVGAFYLLIVRNSIEVLGAIELES